MTDDIFVYVVDLPEGVHEVVTPCHCGYTVYLNSMDNRETQMKAYGHALHHIENNDFEKNCVQSIELSAHGGNDETDSDIYAGIIGGTGQ